MTKDKSPISSERLDAFFEAVPRFVPPYRDRMLRWLATADHLTSRVASGTSIYEEQAVFVVRLAGVLTDLRERFSGPTLSPEMIAKGGHPAELREELRMRVVNAIADLHGRLTEDELLWLELRRHEESHPFLDGYRPKASDSDRWDQRGSKILDKRVLPIDEVIERCARLESAHGGFVGVAVSIARKVLQHVGAVNLAMIPLMAGLCR